MRRCSAHTRFPLVGCLLFSFPPFFLPPPFYPPHRAALNLISSFCCSESICFPAISCGVRGCPHELGAQIALRTIASTLREQFSITNDFQNYEISHQDPRNAHGSIEGGGGSKVGGRWRGWQKDRPQDLSSLTLVE